MSNGEGVIQVKHWLRLTASLPPQPSQPF